MVNASLKLNDLEVAGPLWLISLKGEHAGHAHARESHVFLIEDVTTDSMCLKIKTQDRRDPKVGLKKHFISSKIFS